MAAQSFLRDHPDLRPFLLSSARPTGRTIGTGSYGSVEEVAIPGTVCAAKKIHDFFQDPRQMPRHGIEKAASEFVRECQLMSTLRHPHIVQFLGVCFLPGSPMPALVMEKLVTSLHDVLDPEPPPRTRAFVPVSLKRSVLHDVARGLSFLHSVTPEPIIHRDLSARNVLLNEGMVAKITNLGTVLVRSTLRPSIKTMAPGASIYMPPEALEDESRYNTRIDIFSLGVLAIFTFSEMFPIPLAAAYEDEESGRMVGRTELERCEKYMAVVTKQFREGHPLITMIQQCMKNKAKQRPDIGKVCGLLEEARREVGDEELDVNKLLLIQLLHSRNITISQEIDCSGAAALKQQVDSQKDQVDNAMKENDVQSSQIKSLGSSTSPSTPVNKFLRWPLSLGWAKGNDTIGCNLRATAVVLNGLVYCGCKIMASHNVILYNPESGDWSELPKLSVKQFEMTSFNNQLVLVGGYGEGGIIRVWDSDSKEWVQPYPPMLADRPVLAALGYQKYLIVAYRYGQRTQLNVLDSSSGRWYISKHTPVHCYSLLSVVVGDRWYISSWQNIIFYVHLPTLISSVTSGGSTTPQLWQELPTPPVKGPTPIAFHGHLLLIGGGEYEQGIHRYDQDTNQWIECELLPVGMQAPCCAVLPSGDLMVTGGHTGDTKKYSKRTWIAKISS